MTRIYNEGPRSIYFREGGAFKKTPSGELLETTRQFIEFFEALGVKNPQVDGVFPQILPVAIVDQEEAESHHLLNTGIIEDVAGTQDHYLYGTAAATAPTTEFPFFRLNWVLHMLRHSGASETRTIEIFANFPTSNPASPSGTEVVNLLRSNESLASGTHRRLIVPMKTTGAEDWETIQLSGASSGPTSVIAHQGAGLHKIPTAALRSIRIRVGNADNATMDQRVIASFSFFRT